METPQRTEMNLNEILPNTEHFSLNEITQLITDNFKKLVEQESCEDPHQLFWLAYLYTLSGLMLRGNLHMDHNAVMRLTGEIFNNILDENRLRNQVENHKRSH